MSAEINPKAFPVPNDANVNNQEGMSLRDYFAARALQSLVLHTEDCPTDTYDISEIAALAYKYADAMLSEREE